MKILAQGAEATIEQNKNIVIKKRISKSYRLREIDEKITKLRTRSEAKILKKAGKIISIPKVLDSDEKLKTISMDFIDGKKLSQELNNLKNQIEIMQQIGESISKLHNENIIHGDLTTSNIIYVEKDKTSIKRDSNSKEGLIKGNLGSLYFIDFGLGYQNGKYEDKAVDIHLLKQALEAKHFQNWQELFKAFEKGYLSINATEAKKVLERLKAVEKRGRYKH
jgi:tRNA A-37 threonylcarbamoyl transferase component Bud32